MDRVDCKGFMIPGLYFSEGYSVWLLNWDETPTASPYLTQLWLFHPDGKRVCYLDPVEERDFFNTYHNFDEVVGANIVVSETKEGLEVKVKSRDEIRLKVKKGSSFTTDQLFESVTETGKAAYNYPSRLVQIETAEAHLKGTTLGRLSEAPGEIMVGSGSASKLPLINYCTHSLEQ